MFDTEYFITFLLSKADMEDLEHPERVNAGGVEEALNALDAAGYVILPREPTREMWAASGDALVGMTKAGIIEKHHDVVSQAVWTAMLKSAGEKK